MDFGFTPEEEKFREEVREWLEKEPPGKFKMELEDEGYGCWGVSREFTRHLGAKGWLAPDWPVEYGGQGRTSMEKLILVMELAKHRAPTFLHFAAELVGPTIMLYGTEEQKRDFLPKMASGKTIICECMSEPDAGSDAAAINTQAMEDGDYYIINGQKTWTSLAHLADWCWVTVLTDPSATPRYKGISSFIIDAKTPGITIRPIINMAGEQSFNEVFFDNVRVPKSNLLGKINNGWYQLLAALDSERCWSRAGMAWYCGEILKDLITYTKETKNGGDSLNHNPLIRQKLAQLAIDIEACRILQYRVAWIHSRNTLPNYEASMAKVYADELSQRLAMAGMEILGFYGQLKRDSKWSVLKGMIGHMYVNSYGKTIAAGASEIQRNIIAQRGLKLPRS